MEREEEKTVFIITENKDGSITKEKTIVTVKVLPKPKKRKECQKDCFAYSPIKCIALHNLYCHDNDCRFYKNIKEKEKENNGIKSIK